MSNKSGRFFFKFHGLLRIYELYLPISFSDISKITNKEKELHPSKIFEKAALR